MLSDPRIFSSSSEEPIVELAQQSLAAEIPVRQEKVDAALREELAGVLRGGEGGRLALAIEHAPSVDVARHVWRRLAEAFSAADEQALVTRVFALPMVIVAAAAEPVRVDCVLTDIDELIALLQEHGALAGNRNFALGNALVGPSMLDWARLPMLHKWQSLAAGEVPPVRTLEPVPIELVPPYESVHVRFIVGAALASAGVDIFGRSEVGKWGMPFAQLVARQLTRSGLTLLALPREPMSPVLAGHTGKMAQREVSLQLYVSNAIREIRASVGEPSAVISAHRAAEAPGGGELRVSLSSPFNAQEKRAAEGFRCPLYALDRVVDVERAIVALLQDCRVTDVRIVPGIYPDRDPVLGHRLFIRPEGLAEVARLALQ